MKELLKEMLIEYQQKYEAKKAECIELMKQNKEWESKAKEAAGLKLMIEATILELEKYA